MRTLLRLSREAWNSHTTAMSTICAGLDTVNEMALAESSTKEALSWIIQRRDFQDQQSGKKATSRNASKYWMGGIILVMLLLLLSATSKYNQCLIDLKSSLADRDESTSQNTSKYWMVGIILVMLLLLMSTTSKYRQCLTNLKSSLTNRDIEDGKAWGAAWGAALGEAIGTGFEVFNLYVEFVISGTFAPLYAFVSPSRPRERLGNLAESRMEATQ